MKNGLLARVGEVLTSGVGETPTLDMARLSADELERRALLESLVDAKVVCVRGRVDEPRKVVMAIDLRL